MGDGVALSVKCIARCIYVSASRSAAPRSAAPRSAAPRSAAPRSAAPRSAAPRSGLRALVFALYPNLNYTDNPDPKVLA